MAALLVGGMATAERPPVYEVIDLGRLGFIHDPGGRLWASGPSVAGTFDINNREQVAYARVVSDGLGGEIVQPWLFTLRSDYGLAAGAHSMLQEFGPSGVSVGAALDINDEGVVVGQIGGSALFEGDAHVWILHPSDPLQTQHVTIPRPPGHSWARAVSVSESAPWSVLVQTGIDQNCPLACGGGGAESLEHVASFVVTVTATGTVSAPIWLTGDADCQNTVTAWAAGPAAGGFVGSDILLTNGFCSSGPGSSCGSGQSGLRWSAAGAVGDLTDFDPGQSDDQPSEGRSIAADGVSVGYGIEATDGVCLGRALLRDASGNIAEALHDAALQGGDDAAPLTDRSITVAEGINDLPERLVVGWDTRFDRGVVWYETGGPTSTWEVMFPGVGTPRSSGTLVSGTCLVADEERAADVEPTHLYDVNENIAIVGRADVSGIAGSSTAELHLVVLLPRIGCTGADVNRDGSVDFIDLLEVLAAWDTVCENCSWCPADTDGNRVVDFSDLLNVLASWTVDCLTFSGPPQSVQDCWERYGSDPAAFEACVETLPAP